MKMPAVATVMVINCYLIIHHPCRCNIFSFFMDDPSFGVICTKTAYYRAATSLDSPEEFFFITFDECCSMSFEFEYTDCLKNSQLVVLGKALDDPYGDNGDSDDTPQEPAILIEFGGKLYFRNVFIPSGTPANMRIIRDAILNSVKMALEGYRVVDLEGLNFDGIDLGGLDDMLTFRQRRRLSEQEILKQEVVLSEAITPGAIYNLETFSRMLSRMQLVVFEMAVCLPCDRSCSADITSTGRSTSINIAALLEESIKDGTLF